MYIKKQRNVQTYIEQLIVHELDMSKINELIDMILDMYIKRLHYQVLVASVDLSEF